MPPTSGLTASSLRAPRAAAIAGILFSVLLIASFAMLSIAVRTLPVGTAYAVWVGIGAVGTAILGMIVYAEPATIVRVGSLALIVVGIIGLKLAA